MKITHRPSPLSSSGLPSSLVSRSVRCLTVIGLIVLLGLMMAGPAQAESPAEAPGEGEEPAICGSCHPAENKHWLHSTHALIPDSEADPIASCEVCHGEYVPGHPDDGIVEIRVDSSMCQDCHAETFEQWQGTIHAKADVQCISCHMSHSQDRRLTDDRLCQACHKEPQTDGFHITHWYGDVACTNCHMSPGKMVEALVMDPTQQHYLEEMLTPTHDFTAVSSGHCLDCHRESVSNPDGHTDVRQQAITELRTEQARNANLSYRLENARQSTRDWQIMTPVSLGMGIGVGGMLGIIFMLFAARFTRKDGA